MSVRQTDIAVPVLMRGRCGTMGRVSQRSIEEFVVEYAPGPAVERADRWRRVMRMRLISLGISVAVLIGLYVWQRDRFNENPAPMIVMYALVLLVGIGWAVGSWLAYRRAREVARSIPEGTAMRISRAGVELAGERLGWAEVAAVRTAKGRWPSGPLLEVARTQGGAVGVPLEQLPVFPATLDTTIRAYSGGRHGLDLSAVDA